MKRDWICSCFFRACLGQRRATIDSLMNKDILRGCRWALRSYAVFTDAASVASRELAMLPSDMKGLVCSRQTICLTASSGIMALIIERALSDGSLKCVGKRSSCEWVLNSNSISSVYCSCRNSDFAISRVVLWLVGVGCLQHCAVPELA